MDDDNRKIILRERAELRGIVSPEVLELLGDRPIELHVGVPASDGGDDVERRAPLLRQLQRAALGLQRQHQLAALGELCAGVLHETRNMITGVAGFAQLARDQPDRHDHGRRMLELIERETARGLALLDRFLHLARTGRDELEAVRVPDVLELVAAASTHQLTLRQIRLRVNVAAELPPVRARAEELQQVVLNLVINAMHAIGGSGEISIVACQVDPGHLEIAVEDDGPGIPVELRELVFEPFFTTRSSAEGTGLGLSLSRRIIEALGGTLSIDAAATRGARMVIHLPLANSGPREGPE